MLRKRDKQIICAILTLQQLGVSPGVKIVGPLLRPPLKGSTCSIEINRLIRRGILIREPRRLGCASHYRLTREGLAMAQAAGVSAMRLQSAHVEPCFRQLDEPLAPEA